MSRTASGSPIRPDHLHSTFDTLSTDLPVLETLRDGSYISKLSDPVAANKRRDQVRKHVRNLVDVPGHRVRVIEYQVTDRDGAEAEPETYRLVTPLLDRDEVPATELCSLYHRRWELESTFNEIKTSQRGAGIKLRSNLRLWSSRSSTRSCSPITPSAS